MTRVGVLDKTDALVAKVGYASYIIQPAELNKRFSKLNISSDSFFQNNLNVDKWIRYRLFNKLRKPVDKTKWPMFPQTINAMYQFYENEIVIPAGILQPPFFYDGDVPRALSYGAIGSIIGHELTHGFDNTGRKFDKNGDIVTEWWSDASLREFNKRAKCIEKQYSKYKVQGLYPISGKLTLGENIADNGGTKLAYDAYLDWLENNSGSEPKLPGLKYDNTQLFFIGYAQEYCANVRQKTEYIATLSEIHSPSKFRVIGTLSNFQQFSNAFQCSSGKKMNAPHKYEVW